MSFTATARSLDGSLRHAIDVNGRHTIITDEPEHLGGGDTAPTPHELLAAALASCVSTMIVLYANRHDWTTDDVAVDVAYDSESTPRRMTVTVHLPAGLTPEQIRRLERVAATCPVRRSLEAGFTVAETVVADAGTSGAFRS